VNGRHAPQPLRLSYKAGHMLYGILSVVAALLAAGRVTGHKGEAFQAAAHLFVGGLVAAGTCRTGTPRRWFWGLAAALSVVEVVAFIVMR
jgi:hypothetical protein